MTFLRFRLPLGSAFRPSGRPTSAQTLARKDEDVLSEEALFLLLLQFPLFCLLDRLFLTALLVDFLIS